MNWITWKKWCNFFAKIHTQKITIDVSNFSWNQKNFHWFHLFFFLFVVIHDVLFMIVNKNWFAMEKKTILHLEIVFSLSFMHLRAPNPLQSIRYSCPWADYILHMNGTTGNLRRLWTFPMGRAIQKPSPTIPK